MGLFSADKPEYNSIPYWLAVTRVRLSATRITETTEFGSSTKVQDVHVEAINEGDTSSGLALRTGVGTSDFTVALSADGRLQSVQYKHTGAAPTVIGGTVKLLGFLASTAAAAVGRRGGLSAEASPVDAAWERDHPEAVQLLAKYEELAETAANQLVSLRSELVAATDPASIRTLSVRIDATTRALKEARAEISRLKGLRANWLEAQTTTDTATIERLVSLETIPTRPAGALDKKPAVPAEGEPGFELYRDFCIILQIVDSSRDHKAKHAAAGHGELPPNEVTWRTPRSVELWVWSVREHKTEAHLISRARTRIVDNRCEAHSMTLRAGALGEHGGTWAFGDDGAPTGITTSDKSSVAALFDALGAAPEQVAGALEQAKKATDSWNGVMDADAERAKSAAERDLAAAKARVERLGVNATAADAAAVAKAEQDVKWRTARRSTTAAADTVDDLKEELDRVKTQNDLDTANRTAVVEDGLVDVKAEVARLQQDVLIAKALYEQANPDKPAS